MKRHTSIVSIILFVVCSGLHPLSSQGEESSNSTAATPQGTSLSLPSGKVEEKCLRLQPGQIIVYSFESSAPVHFNIHYHHEGTTYHPVWQKNAPAGQGRYRAELQRTFCAMWKNNSAEPISLKYQVYVEP